MSDMPKPITSQDLLDLLLQHPHFGDGGAYEEIDIQFIHEVRKLHGVKTPEIQKAIYMMLEYPEKFYDPVGVLRRNWAFQNGVCALYPPANQAAKVTAEKKQAYEMPHFKEALDWYHALDSRRRAYIDFYIPNARRGTMIENFFPWARGFDNGVNKASLIKVWRRRAEAHPNKPYLYQVDPAFNSPQTEEIKEKIF